tara:strand:+ start:226 stop:435 length:210 start_codon:yes stop_codon:yes gene_type:complete
LLAKKLIGNVDKTKKTLSASSPSMLSAEEFDKKYPHLKDHADYKNYDRVKKLSTTGYIAKRNNDKKNSR